MIVKRKSHITKNSKFPYLHPMQAFMYILKCANGQYYTGSTKKRINKRITEHHLGQGANFTKKHLPVKLVHYEEFLRIDEAFKREKQVQRWSRKKKEALIEGNIALLKELAKKKIVKD
jgi:putative endonuclease